MSNPVTVDIKNRSNAESEHSQTIKRKGCCVVATTFSWPLGEGEKSLTRFASSLFAEERSCKLEDWAIAVRRIAQICDYSVIPLHVEWRGHRWCLIWGSGWWKMGWEVKSQCFFGRTFCKTGANVNYPASSSSKIVLVHSNTANTANTPTTHCRLQVLLLRHRLQAFL